MFSFLYNCLIFAFGIPSLLIQRCVKGKYKGVLLEKIGLRLPSISVQEQPVFWIHSVSLGETKAAKPFILRLRKTYPDAYIVLSTMTETGFKEAHTMQDLNHIFYLPLDFSWTMKRLMRKLRPNAIFLIENDVWYHWLYQAKRFGSKVYWLSAKLSENSFKRYRIFSIYAKKVFSLFDQILAQTLLYKDRFRSFVPEEKLSIGGDLKYDATVNRLSSEQKAEWQEKLGIKPNDFVITIACTHAPEEETILLSLKGFLEKNPTVKILLAPRHPERFSQVLDLLKKKNLSCSALSQNSQDKNLILIDKMGFLPTCYELSQLAIVGGSFAGNIGGHNILEPCLFHVPVLFGPYMHKQQDLKEKVLKAKAGELVFLQDLPTAIEYYFSNPEELASKKWQAEKLVASLRGSLEKSWKRVFSDRD